MAVAFAFYKPIIPNIWYQDLGSPLDQLLRVFSNRTGIISFGVTPLAVILAGRNSPVAWLTGASYSTLQIYHRWVARMAFFHGLAHGITYSLQEWFHSLPGGTNWYTEEFAYAYWNWGVAALVGGATLSFASHRRIRELYYEIFLVAHIAGAIVWVVGCFYHVYLLDPKCTCIFRWIYAAVALWVFDRFARIIRPVYHNNPSLFNKKNSRSQAAEGYLIGSGAFLRLRITMPTAWPASFGGPGTYVFITAPKHEALASYPSQLIRLQGCQTHRPPPTPRRLTPPRTNRRT